MALNILEIGTIAGLIKNLGGRPRVLSLGYPDLLITPDAIKSAGVDLDWDGAAKRTDDTRAVWMAHGRANLSSLPMLETKQTLALLGAEPVVSDAIRWGGEDIVFDLNEPLSAAPGLRPCSFDLIVDPGTLEHCFNIAQAFDNVDRLLKPGGYVYHQAAAAFPNHGFWSISPTAFYDFYQSRGYILGKSYYWSGSTDIDGLLPHLTEAAAFAPVTGASMLPLICSYVFRKSESAAVKTPGFPTQRCYSSFSRDIHMVDFVKPKVGKPTA